MISQYIEDQVIYVHNSIQYKRKQKEDKKKRQRNTTVPEKNIQ